jgi:hypothetical protein
MLVKLAHRRAFSWAWVILLLIVGILAQAHA